MTRPAAGPWIDGIPSVMDGRRILVETMRCRLNVVRAVEDTDWSVVARYAEIYQRPTTTADQPNNQP